MSGSLTCSTLELGEDGLGLAVPLSTLLQGKAADMRGPALSSSFKRLYSLSPSLPREGSRANSKGG